MSSTETCKFEKSKQGKSNTLPVLKKKGPGKIQSVTASMRRGSYGSAGFGSSAASRIRP